MRFVVWIALTTTAVLLVIYLVTADRTNPRQVACSHLGMQVYEVRDGWFCVDKDGRVYRGETGGR